MDSFRLFRRHSKGRRGEELMLHVKEGWDCMQLAVGDDVIESLWVRITGKANNADVGVCHHHGWMAYRTGVLFCRELRDFSRLFLILLCDFSLPDVNWEYHTMDTDSSRKFLKHVGDNYLVRALWEPTRKGALLDLLLVKQRGSCG